MAEIWSPTWRKRFLLRTAGVMSRAMHRRRARGNAASSSNARADVRDILVVELWNIGDVILTLPFLAQIRWRFPGARITLLARAHAREILLGTRVVDEFIVADLAWSEKSTHGNPFRFHWRALFRVWRQLRARQFDIAFQARPHVREQFILAMTGAKRRVGVALGEERGALTDAAARRDPSGHKVDDWLALLEPFGGVASMPAPTLAVIPSEQQWADEFLERAGLTGSEELIAIHPGASVAEKRWPVERFAEVARTLAAEPGVAVLWFVDQAGYGRLSGEALPVTQVSVGLREMISLLSRCELLVSNDSGPMHIAAALSVPVVAVFGSGIAGWFAPFGGGHEIITIDDTQESDRFERGGGIGAVTTEMVLAAVERVRTRIWSAHRL